MKPRAIVIIVAALQVLLLASMAIHREWILGHGTMITLRTAPLDPDDAMRGAYVRFGYELGAVPTPLCEPAIQAWARTTDYKLKRRLRDRLVYAQLKTNEHGFAELVALRKSAPEQGLFLRGRVETLDEREVHVRYGVEALFMNKDDAQAMERKARAERAGAPIDVSIAVGASGIGVIKDHAWEPLGLTLAFDSAPPTPAPAAARSFPARRSLRGVTVTLHNYSDHDLAIVDLPAAQSFRLIPEPGLSAEANFRWMGAGQPRARATDRDVVLLKPGATHGVHIDLSSSGWWVQDLVPPDSPPQPIDQLGNSWQARFRIEYAPPDAAACRDLPNAPLIRHVPLRSAAFGPFSGAD